MNTSLEALENQYILLRSSLDAFTAQGATPEQISQLRLQIVQSRTNYWKAIRSILHDDDPQIETLVEKLNAEQADLAKTLERFSDVAKVLNLVTKVVHIGSQIVSKAIAV